MVDRFFSLWALVIPITSVVLIPSVKGTLPSYFFAMLSLLIGIKYRRAYPFSRLLKLSFVFVLMIVISQFCVLICNEFLPDLILVDGTDLRTIAFRSSLLTQSIYLIPCVLVYIYTACFYKPSWDKWIFAGGTILALYGIYEWGYFLLTGENGDFLSNRWFGDSDGTMNGSLFQTLQLGGYSVQRMKSLVGEPSMYAYSMLAYWIYALHTGRKKLAFFYFTTLLLSTSTTMFVGVLMYGMYWIYKYAKVKNIVFLGIVGVAVTIFFYDIIYDFVDKMLLAKMYMENTSGEARGANIIDALIMFVNSPLPIELFGWGWGTIRSTDFFSTLLINTGVVGYFLWTLAVLYPCVMKNNSYRDEGIKIVLIIEYFVMMISVPEFSYMFYWMFLGIAYNSIRNCNAEYTVAKI